MSQQTVSVHLTIGHDIINEALEIHNKLNHHKGKTVELEQTQEKLVAIFTERMREIISEKVTFNASVDINGPQVYADPIDHKGIPELIQRAQTVFESLIQEESWIVYIEDIEFDFHNFNERQQNYLRYEKWNYETCNPEWWGVEGTSVHEVHISTMIDTFNDELTQIIHEVIREAGIDPEKASVEINQITP